MTDSDTLERVMKHPPCCNSAMYLGDLQTFMVKSHSGPNLNQIV